jgi:hypothetical protein
MLTLNLANMQNIVVLKDFHIVRVVFIGIEDRYWTANDCGYEKIIT